jgi:flagellar basal-body rod protein FlgF
MDNSQLIGLSQLDVLQRKMDIIANNLANIGTSGYRAEQPIFSEYLMPVASDSTSGTTDAEILFVEDRALHRDFSFGRMEQTGNELDVALNGEGWLVIETADGERYTRAGGFTLDDFGQLTTMQGHPVLGDGGPIAFQPNESHITIAADGTISSSAGLKGRLRVVTFADERVLAKEAANLFSSPEAPVAAVNPRVSQGVRELSNVNAIQQISEMIQVTRAYEATARMLADTNELESDAIDTLGTASA